MDPVCSVGERQRLLEGEASTSPKSPRRRSGERLRAGLVLFKDAHRFASSSCHFAAQDITPGALNDAKEVKKTEGQKSFHPRVTSGSGSATPSFQCALTFRESESDNWTNLGTIDALNLTGFDFVRPLIGISATGGSDAEGQFDTSQADWLGGI